jgi:hypothetical protein
MATQRRLCIFIETKLDGIGKMFNLKRERCELPSQAIIPRPYVGSHQVRIGAIFEDGVTKPAKGELHEPAGEMIRSPVRTKQ